MARRNRKRTKRHCLGDQLLQRVKRDYDHTPLSEIGSVIADGIQFAKHSDSEESGEFLRGIENCLDALPSGRQLSVRFGFDATLIQAIRDQWTTGKCGLPQMILPKYGNEWGHQPIHLPSAQRERIPRVDLILFPFGDDLDDLDLLVYPWLVHELAHVLLMTVDEPFGNELHTNVHEYLKSARLRALAASDTVRQRQESVLRTIEDGWIRNGKGGNWAFEIAADTVAVWTTGPAFLTCFCDVIANHRLDLFRIDHSHPSYEMRTKAILMVGDQLGWHQECRELTSRLD